MNKLVFLFCFVLVTAIHAAGQNTPALQQDLALKYLVQPPTEKTAHTPVIILLHGYGSDEKDLFELRTAFPKSYLIVSARAPYNLPGGGYEWYEPAQVNGGRDGKKDEVDNSRHLIEQFIKQVVTKYKADGKQVYLMGFSQGAIMSYQVGLTDPEAVHGIAPLSGMIFESLKPMIKNTPALKQLRIFVSHGAADQRIPFAEGKAAVDYVKSIGLHPDFHEYPGMGHSISNEVLNDLVKWCTQNGTSTKK